MENSVIKPFTPQEAAAQFQKNIPEFVITAVNGLLSEKCANTRTTVTLLQDDVVERIMKEGNIPKEERLSVYDKHYLDFEELYAEYGWRVKHDKPGYNEDCKASFKFIPKEVK